MTTHPPPRGSAQDQCRDVPGRRPVLERQLAFEGLIWDVVRERIDLGSGTVVTRDFVQHPGAVAVIAWREPGEVLLLRQYRHAVGRELWEPPAGLLDQVGEDPLAAAQRELFEEADLAADTWNVLVDFLSTPGGSSEAIRIYLARDLRPIPESERFAREAEELDMTERWVPLEKALEAVAEGHMGSPTAVVGLYAVDAARRMGWASLRPADAPWDRP